MEKLVATPNGNFVAKNGVVITHPLLPNLEWTVFPSKMKVYQDREAVDVFQVFENSCGKLIVEPTRFSMMNEQGIAVLHTDVNTCCFTQDAAVEQFNKVVNRNNPEWIIKLVKAGNDYQRSVKPRVFNKKEEV